MRLGPADFTKSANENINVFNEGAAGRLPSIDQGGIELLKADASRRRISINRARANEETVEASLKSIISDPKERQLLLNYYSQVLFQFGNNHLFAPTNEANINIQISPSGVANFTVSKDGNTIYSTEVVKKLKFKSTNKANPETKKVKASYEAKFQLHEDGWELIEFKTKNPFILAVFNGLSIKPSAYLGIINGEISIEDAKEDFDEAYANFISTHCSEEHNDSLIAFLRFKRELDSMQNMIGNVNKKLEQHAKDMAKAIEAHTQDKIDKLSPEDYQLLTGLLEKFHNYTKNTQALNLSDLISEFNSARKANILDDESVGKIQKYITEAIPFERTKLTTKLGDEKNSQNIFALTLRLAHLELIEKGKFPELAKEFPIIATLAKSSDLEDITINLNFLFTKIENRIIATNDESNKAFLQNILDRLKIDNFSHNAKLQLAIMQAVAKTFEEIDFKFEDENEDAESSASTDSDDSTVKYESESFGDEIDYSAAGIKGIKEHDYIFQYFEWSSIDENDDEQPNLSDRVKKLLGSEEALDESVAAIIAACVSIKDIIKKSPRGSDRVGFYSNKSALIKKLLTEIKGNELNTPKNGAMSKFYNKITKALHTELSHINSELYFQKISTNNKVSLLKGAANILLPKSKERKAIHDKNSQIPMVAMTSGFCSLSEILKAAEKTLIPVGSEPKLPEAKLGNMLRFIQYQISRQRRKDQMYLYQQQVGEVYKDENLSILEKGIQIDGITNKVMPWRIAFWRKPERLAYEESHRIVLGSCIVKDFTSGRAGEDEVLLGLENLEKSVSKEQQTPVHLFKTALAKRYAQCKVQGEKYQQESLKPVELVVTTPTKRILANAQAANNNKTKTKQNTWSRKDASTLFTNNTDTAERDTMYGWMEQTQSILEARRELN